MSSTPNTSWLRSADPWIWTTVLMAVAVAALVLSADKSIYEAHAAVEVEPASNQVLNNDALILQAARKAGLQADEEFNQPPGNPALVANAKGHLSLRNDGQIVQISFRASNANRAAAFANSLVDAYNDELDSRGLAKAIELNAALEAVQTLIDEKETRLSQPGLTTPQATTLVREANRQRELYDAILARASSSPTHQGARFADRAEVPVEAMNANSWTGLALGVPLVLFGGALFMVARIRMKQQPAAPAQLEVMCSQDEIEKPVVAVANAGTGHTNPETLLDYVENLLEGRNKVLIIDCEVAGTLTQSVGLRGEFGFTDFVLDSPVLRGAIPAWKTNRDGVSVMPAGTRPNRIPVLLSTPGVREALATLLAVYDRVVINAPAILSTGEMRDLSPLVDGVIVVTPQDRSLGLAHLAVQQVEEFGGKVIGLVEDAHQLAVL